MLGLYSLDFVVSLSAVTVPSSVWAFSFTTIPPARSSAWSGFLTAATPWIPLLLTVTLISIVVAALSIWFLSRTASLARDRALGREVGAPENRLVEYTTKIAAELAAQERREAIQAFLRQRDVSMDDAVPLREEFLERRGTLADAPTTSFQDDGASGLWHAVRLRWQIEKPERLLAERVVDVITLLSHSADPANRRSGEYYVVRLTPLPRALRRRRSLFPWRVVIESDENSTILRDLRDALERDRELREWLGIGIDWRYGQPLRLYGYGHCQVGQGGFNGTVSGVVQSADDTLGVSCAHVLSSGCGSRFWPQKSPNGSYNTRRPDAALIRIGSSCFGKNIAKPETLAFLPDSRLESMAIDHTCVVRRSPRGSRDGIVRDLVSAFALGDVAYRGPHLAVIPRLSRRVVMLPLMNREFSRDGDSGSWVVDAAGKTWVGIVIGGSDYPLTQTYVLPSSVLVPWFSRGLGVASLTAHLTL